MDNRPYGLNLGLGVFGGFVASHSAHCSSVIFIIPLRFGVFFGRVGFIPFWL